ncbi:MAG: hypothetical protein J3K34DRAFT_401786 [Monoraphidium minutum]|nr:MAG: hypothetical protein J3K34DRAFT_401786 [Monoraphidium minutum]
MPGMMTLPWRQGVFVCVCVCLCVCVCVCEGGRVRREAARRDAATSSGCVTKPPFMAPRDASRPRRLHPWRPQALARGVRAVAPPLSGRSQTRCGATPQPHSDAQMCCAPHRNKS